jgi:hypothetical protein
MELSATSSALSGIRNSRTTPSRNERGGLVVCSEDREHFQCQVIDGQQNYVFTLLTHSSAPSRNQARGVP